MSRDQTWFTAVATSSGLTVAGWVACRRRSRVSPARRTGYLVQAGYIVGDWSGSRSFPFYEIVGGTWDTVQAVDTGYPTIGAGQRGYYYVQYVTAQTWAVTISNLDTGVTYSRNLNHSAGGTQYLGPEGDFISERLQVGSVLTQYTHHGDGRMRSAIVYFGGGATARMSIQQPQNIDLLGRNGSLLGYADSRLFLLQVGVGESAADEQHA